MSTLLSSGRLDSVFRDGFQNAVRHAIQHHHLDNRTVPVMHNGEIYQLHRDGTLTPTAHRR